MDETRFDYLLTRKITGEISAAEESDLQQWLAISPEHQRLCKKMEGLWRAAEPPALPFSVNSANEWLQLTRRLGIGKHEISPGESQPAGARSKVRWPIFTAWPRLRPASAALVAVVLVAVAIYLTSNWQDSENYREVVTANARRVEATLPDGSFIRLNNASRIRFLPNFSDSLRQVFLDGEAYFQVAKSQRPFVVSTAHAKVRVLSTAFNVYARDAQARIVVQAGQVMVRSTDGDASRAVIVKAGEMTQCRNGENPTAPQLVDVASRLGWLEGKLVFVQTPLAEVSAELERFYNVPVRLADASLGARTITATFQNQSLGSVISAICLTLDLSYHYKAREYVIKE